MRRFNSILSLVLALALHSRAESRKPEPLSRANEFISVSFEPLSGKLSVLDQRTKHTGSQAPLAADIEVQNATSSENAYSLPDGRQIKPLGFIVEPAGK